MTEPDGRQVDLSKFHFELPGGGHALFTTRAEGNLSTMRGPGHEQGRDERDRLCEQLGLRWLCASRQVHGAVVQRVRTQEGSAGEAVALDADGHATALRGVGAMVLVADCLPVILGTEGAVAALHAGWRGVAAGVLEEGVRALRELGGEGDITAVIGPGAGPCCYEVGPEVHAAFGDRFGVGPEGIALGGRSEVGAVGHAVPGDRSEVGRRRPRARNLDLPRLARERLAAAGVGRIEDVGVCTICDERLFSHRREGLRAGRQAGIAWLS